MTKNDETPQRMPLKLEIIAASSGTAITVSIFGTVLLLLPQIGVDLERMSFFLVYRAILFIGFSMAMIPFAVLGEFVASQYKLRRFRWKNLAGGLSLASLFLAVTLPLLTIFDLLFSWFDIAWQMPLTAACTSIGLVTMAFVARGEKYRKWLKSAEW